MMDRIKQFDQTLMIKTIGFLLNDALDESEVEYYLLSIL